MTDKVNITQYTQLYEKYNELCDVSLLMIWNYTENVGNITMKSEACNFSMEANMIYANNVCFVED